MIRAVAWIELVRNASRLRRRSGRRVLCYAFRFSVADLYSVTLALSALCFCQGLPWFEVLRAFGMGRVDFR